MRDQLGRHGTAGHSGTPAPSTTALGFAYETVEPVEERELSADSDVPTEELDRLAGEFLALDSASTVTWIASLLGLQNASRELLLMGASSGEFSWVEAVASNANSPDDVAAMLLRGSAVLPEATWSSVRVRVIRVASLEVLGAHAWETEMSVAVLRTCLERFASEQARPIALMQRVADQLMSVAPSSASLQIAAKWTTDPARLLQLCAHASRWVRHEAEQNVACPEEGRVMVALLN